MNHIRDVDRVGRKIMGNHIIIKLLGGVVDFTVGIRSLLL